MRFLFHIFIFILFIANVALSANQACLTTGLVQQGNKIITHDSLNNQPQLILLHNNSQEELIVAHSQLQKGASAGWSSYLRPKNWSALMVAQPRFGLVCYKMQQESFVEVNCNIDLDVCYLSSFKDKQHLGTGTFWVAEDLPFDGLMQKIKERQIIVDQDFLTQQSDDENGSNA